jgi:uncharacterized membrane protein
MESQLWQIVFRDPNKLALIIALIIGAIGAFLVYRSTNPDTPRARRIAMAILRFIAVAVIIFSLADPVIRAIRNREITPSVVLLVDNSQSMSIVDNTGDRSVKVSEIISSKVLKNISEKYPIHKFLFSDSLYKWKEPDFSGQITSMGIALSELLDTAEKLEIGAVLILSDGQNNIGVDPEIVAMSFPFPIHTIGIGDPNPMPDAMVSEIVANPVAYVGEELTVFANIRGWRLGGTQVNAQLIESGKMIGSQQIELPNEGQVVTCKYKIEPKKPGTKYYTIRIPILQNEVLKNNNEKSVAIKVLPSRKEVLITCDYLSWDVTFWKRAIESDPNIKTSLFVKQGVGQYNLRRMPSRKEDLQHYALIVLINSAEILTGDITKRLAEYVHSGGSILLIGSENSFRGGPGIREFIGILPVNLNLSRGFVFMNIPVSSGPDALTHPITSIEGFAREVSSLPPLEGMFFSAPKDNSKILMVGKTADGIDLPILAVSEIELGRSAIITGSPTWKWGFLPFAYGRDDRIFRNLSRNLIQYLLAKEKIDRFAIIPGKKVYSSGEPVYISAALRDESNKPVSGAIVNINVSLKDSVDDEGFDFELSEVGEGVYEASIPSLAPGIYDINGTAQVESKSLGKAKSSLVVERYKLEFARTNQDDALLKIISQQTAGKYILSDSIYKLLDIIKIKNKIRTESSEHELWSWPILLFIVIIALGLEWILRKKSNLL